MASSGAAQSRGFTRTSLGVVALCFATILVDGYDLIVYGTVAPALLQYEAWSLTSAQVGFISSLALAALVIGGLVSGPVSDKVGRRRLTMICVAWFSVAMGLCAIAPTPVLFGVFRFLSGLGLGGSIPTVSALVIEHSPLRRRNFSYALMFIGYPVGGIVAAVIAIALIPAFGWRAMFLVGLAPLVLLVPLQYRFMPESVSFLMANGRRREAEDITRRFDLPAEAEVMESATDENTTAQRGALGALKTVFSRNYVIATLLFTVASFMGLLLVYGLNQWLPQIMRDAGYPLRTALSFLLVLNFGAILGAILGSLAADRIGSKPLVLLCFLLGAVSIGLLSTEPSAAVVYVLVALAGLGSVGTQLLVNAWVTRYYPVESRATAVGWAIGFGRVGSIAGPILGGLVLSAGLAFEWSFYAFVIPALLGALIAVLVPKSPARTAPTETSTASVS